MTTFFTADEHYGHDNICLPDFCDRPFDSIDEMDEELIKRHNVVVKEKRDLTYHIGDFIFKSKHPVSYYVNRLNGNHKFIRGSHDHWMHKNAIMIWEGDIEKQQLVMCHYPMESWRWSYHGSWQLHGHWHEGENTRKNRLNVAVDLHNFYPWNWDEIKETIKNGNK